MITQSFNLGKQLMGLALLRFFLNITVGFLLLACVFGLYHIKASDPYKIKQLERRGLLPPPYLDKSDSILGPDLDNNGIRDDIDRYIRENFTKENERKAVEQYAKTTQQQLMVDTTDTIAVQNLNYINSRAFRCVSHTFNTKYIDEDGVERTDGDRGRTIRRSIFAFTMNTYARSKQYLKYNRAMSGKVWSLLRGNTCDE